MTNESSAAEVAGGVLDTIGRSMQDAFLTQGRILTFDAFLERAAAHPERFARSAAQYALDALESFGTTEVDSGRGATTRYHAFDAPFDAGHERVVGHEVTQQALVRVLRAFVRERRVNRLVLIHGPNGSAKSSLVSCLMRALEAYSHTDAGALYRFHWVFPSTKHEGGRIGFDKRAPSGAEAGSSYALLDESLIDAKLPAEQNDNPLFLLPEAERVAFLERAFGETPFALSDTVRRGNLAHRSRAVFDALLTQYRGDFREVMRHVQVERFYISKRYRQGAVTVEPQLRVDASARQLTHDRSLAALPRVLQSQTLFEVFGPLVDGNRGIVEYNDLLKRPMEANKYLLATSEKGTVSLDTGEMHVDALLVATANESYLEAFKQAPDWASYKGRIELIRMPYLLDYRAEQAIYDGQLEAMAIPKPVAPHTTFVAALWAVMTRLRRPTLADIPSVIERVVSELTPLQKALLYADGALPPGISSEQAQQLRLAIPTLFEHGANEQMYEGRFGASPREMKALMVNAAHADAPTMSPQRVFEELQRLVQDKSVYDWLRFEPDGDYHRPERDIATVRAVYLDRVEREVREASGLVDEAEYARLFERYVTHVNHWLRGEKLTDPVSGARLDPDERIMREMEERLGRDGDERRFRSQIISSIAAFRIDQPDAPVSYPSIFPTYFERLKEQYFASKQESLRKIQEQLVRYLDDEPLTDEETATVSSTLGVLEQRFGYTRETAAEAVALLLSVRYAAQT